MICYSRIKATIGGRSGSYGVFSDSGVPFAVGVEPAAPLIPTGLFFVSWYFSPTAKVWRYLLANIPGHAGVEIHIGNQAVESKGCILIGTGFGKSNINSVLDDGVIGSSTAFQVLKGKVGTTNNWRLTVVEI